MHQVVDVAISGGPTGTFEGTQCSAPRGESASFAVAAGLGIAVIAWSLGSRGRAGAASALVSLRAPAGRMYADPYLYVDARGHFHLLYHVYDVHADRSQAYSLPLPSASASLETEYPILRPTPSLPPSRPPALRAAGAAHAAATRRQRTSSPRWSAHDGIKGSA